MFSCILAVTSVDVTVCAGVFVILPTFERCLFTSTRAIASWQVLASSGCFRFSVSTLIKLFEPLGFIISIMLCCSLGSYSPRRQVGHKRFVSAMSSNKSLSDVSVLSFFEQAYFRLSTVFYYHKFIIFYKIYRLDFWDCSRGSCC